MKITKKDITKEDIRELNEALNNEIIKYLNNDEILIWLRANTLISRRKLHWFFTCDAKRNFNYEKI